MTSCLFSLFAFSAWVWFPVLHVLELHWAATTASSLAAWLRLRVWFDLVRLHGLGFACTRLVLGLFCFVRSLLLLDGTGCPGLSIALVVQDRVVVDRIGLAHRI